MNFQRFLCLFLVSFASLLSSSHCYTFYVGGKQGWVLQPKEKYNDWAGRMRFHVNDTLIFKYKKGEDSVLLVKKDDYDKCERKGALMEMSDGNSEYQFPHSGPFYFISGKEGHCQKGQKLITVVMAVRHGGSTTPPGHGPIAKPPTAQPPKGWHPGPIAKPPKGSSPGPGSSPSYGPAQSPYPHGPISMPPTASSPGPSAQYGPSQSPMAHGPISVPPTASSPGPSSTPHAPSPQYGPSQSPMAQGPTASAPSPQGSTPSASSPSPSTTEGPVSGPPAPPQGPSPSTTEGPVSGPPAPPQGPSPSSSTTPSPSGSQTSTPPGGSTPGSNSNSSATTTYSSVMVPVFSVLLSSMIFGGGF